ncbi:lytic transglycosylase domain-containing protein [Chthonobacter rhizosphaerae]|uniref:lytic transglycosylase domain-containing protein n=1 Tax=Chthonobacter rhizosphaerae TaxID=2735553 RepID=UPI0015EE7432|nr:lytic transglycosylase domain-containing protein [Chthonobacter rhizosphaerae]
MALPPRLTRFAALFMAGTMAASTVAETAAIAAPPVAPLTPPVLAAPAVGTAADLAAPVIEVAADGLRQALKAVGLNKYQEAKRIAAGLSPLDRDIVTWMAIRRDVSGLTPSMITEFAARNPHWPSVAMMRRRAEVALARQKMPPRDVVAAFGASEPITEQGIRALARAHLALGDTKRAAAAIHTLWTTETLSPEEDAAILKEFGSALSKSQIKGRFDYLMYNDRVVQASNIGKRLGAGYVALADARAAVLRDQKDAARKLDSVPADLRKQPSYLFTLAEFRRRADRPEAAAEALLAAGSDPAVLIDPDHWWIERRIVSRDLAEKGNAKLAYKVAAAHRGGNAETLAEAHFHAGWYALRFLNDHATAAKHFQALAGVGQKPITRSRAHYWLGRSAEAAGRIDEARGWYTKAAGDPVAFYGQLARVKLGAEKLGLPQIPKPSDADRTAFGRNDLVRVMARLIEAGFEGDAAFLYPELARQLPTAGQLALLTSYLEARGDHRGALQVGKVAVERGMGVERLAYPLNAIPESARNQKAVETAMVYAIARQESAFDPAAVSSAGALGLLQLMPGTAQATARALGVSYSKGKLTTDPGYNATLGAAHLRELVDAYGGSYILTFAAYNAGSRRVNEWIQRFGDPRDGRIDPVDWIEMIPYGETRNYVQRVTENLQVYRERLDGGRLRIIDDLRRGSGT